MKSLIIIASLFLIIYAILFVYLTKTRIPRIVGIIMILCISVTYGLLINLDFLADYNLDERTIVIALIFIFLYGYLFMFRMKFKD